MFFLCIASWVDVYACLAGARASRQTILLTSRVAFPINDENVHDSYFAHRLEQRAYFSISNIKYCRVTFYALVGGIVVNPFKIA